uniref:Peptidase S74 domain-containing protein n=1 Tax=Ditylenchus dipsaci TaxID=166011 RepID=A0A915EDB8_9BILA
MGLTEENRHRVGVIAQELAEVLPDAVRDNGEFLTVDDTRIFYDTVAAAQELYRLTGNLECKIDQVEKISQKLARFAQKRKNHMGSMASGISDFSNLFGTSLGGDNKSYISYSRTSLASNGACEESNERRKRSDDNSKGHRRCRSSASYCQRGDQALCTSKITQGTIVALVVVMALCLMAMCTLYVLDWYNRTYVYFPHHHYGYPHIVSPTPAHPMNSDDGIEKSMPNFCCANHLSYSSKDGGSQGDESTFLELAGQSNVKGKLDLTSQAVFSTAEQLESGVQIQVLNLNATLDQRYCVTEGACNARKGRYNLYVPISDHLPTIPLQLKFSVEDGLFVDNCGILLDFDHKSCQMDIDNGLDGDKDKVTDSRKDRKKAVGRNIRPVSNRVTENIFEVSVGGFLQSAFRFRIGHTTESCNMAEDQQGRSFDEYNLVFYRSCLVDALRTSKVITD